MRFYPELILILALSLYAASAHAFSRSKSVALDVVSQSSLVDGDATGLAEGCGQQPSPLGMFCRQVEGDAATKSIDFIGPPAQCSRDACVFVKVFNNQGAVVFGNSIPKGQTRISVPWSTLLSCAPSPAPCLFHASDRGFWTFNTTVYFLDPAGREESSVSQGDIVLRVFKAGYVPLNAVADDPNYAWSWIDGGFLYKVTSGLRASVFKVVAP